MDSSTKCSVLIAIREAPFRDNNEAGEHKRQSVFTFPKDCSNTLIVDGNLFSFDHAYDATVTQLELYNSLVQPLVLKVLTGYDCTVLAYGQTGTGKSYSMGMTTEQVSEEHVGFLPRCLQDILDRITIDNQNENNEFPKLVYVSFIEVYNEKAYDLLAVDTGKPLASRSQRRFTGGTIMPLRNQQDLQEILLLGVNNRHVRPTNMNKNSSRSHAIVTIHYKQGFHHARLNFVDLAGSEGLRRTGNEGMARSEGVYINMGLLAINKVMLSMSAGHTLIPYRDTILTTVLQESLTAGAYVTLLACVSPDDADLSETISTLRFASSAKQVKLSPRMSQQLQQLQQKLRSAKKRSSSGTTQGMRGVLISSKVIKRPLRGHSQTDTLNSYSTRTKSTMASHGSEMGLTPQTKTCARALLKLSPAQHEVKIVSYMEQSEHKLEQSRSRHSQLAPSLSDFIKLKEKCDTLVCLLEEQRQQQRQLQQRQEEMQQQPENSMSLLNHSDFNSDLCSIAEEMDGAGSNSIPNSVRISGISPLAETPLPIDNMHMISPIIPRHSMRILNRQMSVEQINSSNNLSRSIRFASLNSERPKLTKSNTKNLETKFSIPLTERFSLIKASSGSQESRLRKHRKELLAMLNEADVKDLKKLPAVGPKTAMALIMQRSVLGPFKTWKQVQKLPIWKGGSWERFATANLLNFQKDQH